MPSSAPDDEFERILERCRGGLTGISLDLPEIDPAPPAPRLTLIEPPPAPAPAPKPAPVPEPAPVPISVAEAPRPAAPSVPEPLQPPPMPVSVPPPSPTPVPAPSPRSPVSVPAALRLSPLRLAALAGAAAVLAWAGFWLVRGGETDLSLTLEHADALSSVPGDGVAIAEGYAVRFLDDDGHQIETRPLTGPVSAFSWRESSLWAADGRTAALVEHRADGGTASFALNHVPAALDAHEKYLWSTDAKGKQIRQFLITRSMLGIFLQPLDLYDLPDFTVECFDMDLEGALWLVDAPSRRLYFLKADGSAYKPVKSAPLTPVIGGAGRVKGISVKGGRIWILVSAADGRGPSVLKRLSLRRLAWTPD